MAVALLLQMLDDFAQDDCEEGGARVVDDPKKNGLSAHLVLDCRSEQALCGWRW